MISASYDMQIWLWIILNRVVVKQPYATMSNVHLLDVKIAAKYQPKCLYLYADNIEPLKPIKYHKGDKRVYIDLSMSNYTEKNWQMSHEEHEHLER